MSRWMNPLAVRRNSRRKAAARGRGGGGGGDDKTGVRLKAVNLTVPADLGLVSPTMRMIVVEDMCWDLAREAWRARRPPLWCRARRRAWRAEGAVLDAKRDRIRAVVSGEQPI